METKKSRLSVLTNGIIKENPVLVLLLGTCPTLAISITVKGAIGMGIAAMLVLIGSNFAISLLKDIIPEKVRIPCYIVIVAGFVTIVQLLVKAYTPALDRSLGVYLPLIVVNCIILGRAEMFASKNSPLDSVMDGIGMGLGFTLALVIMASIREILGSGTWFGLQVIPANIPPTAILIAPPGGFFVYGVVIAAINWLTRDKPVVREEFGCGSCPLAKEGEGANE